VAWTSSRLSARTRRCDSHVAESLFEVAKRKYGVNFGNGEYGWCFQIGKKYFWLAPVLQKIANEETKQ
jgi:hypothetical protein